MKRIMNYSIGFCALLSAVSANALTFQLPPPGESVVGEVQKTHLRAGETLTDIGMRYDVGFSEILDSNPKIDPNYGAQIGTHLVIPTKFILPPGPREGIVINLAELRLYYYPKGENVVVTMPVGIGRIGYWQTPTGTTNIVEKVQNPAWRPTPAVREDALKYGKVLPDMIPPGPNNPLGNHMMRLGWRTYLIHGTNDPRGVGIRTSAGCLRMFPEDIKSLFQTVPVGTQVRIMNTPYKIGWLGNELFLEYHEPLVEQKAMYDNNVTPMEQAIREEVGQHSAEVKWELARQEAHTASGIPLPIGSKDRSIAQR